MLTDVIVPLDNKRFRSAFFFNLLISGTLFNVNFYCRTPVLFQQYGINATFWKWTTEFATTITLLIILIRDLICFKTILKILTITSEENL